MTIILPITLTTAGLLALINLWIGYRAGSMRKETGIMLGDGGDPRLIKRVRAHANFNEYAPLFVILLGLCEMAAGDGAHPILWAVAGVFVAGRILHALGMDEDGVGKFRFYGTLMAMVPIVLLALYALYLPFGKQGTIVEDGATADAGPQSDAETVPAE